MNVAALLEELRKRDIHVYADDEDLRCDAPAGALSAEMREHLRERKREILEFLRAPTQLSSSQRRLWFLNELAPGSAAYLIADAFELRGELDVPRLERALHAILRRHESMRTVFVSVDGEPRQHAVEAGAWQLPVVDLSADPERALRLRQELRDESCRGFDLTHELPFRARLYRLAADHHALLLSMHHIVSDGWSLSVLARELAELYASMGRGDAASLPPLRIQYRDYARWQNGRLQGEFIGGLLAHWRARLAGAPQVLELPTDRPRPSGESYRGADHTIGLPRELADGLRRLGRLAGATLFMVLFAGFALVLARYSGQREYLIGTPVANRTRPDFENQVGFFVNTLVLRVDLKGEPTTMELLGRVREVCLDAYAHQDMPFEHLVDEMRPERDLSRNPLFQVMFALQNTPPKPSKMGEVAMRPLSVERTAAQFDLSLDAHETADGLKAVFNYSTDLFDQATVARIANHWRLIMEAMQASPERSVWKLPMLTDEELAQATSGPGAVAEGLPASLPLHEMFEAQVARSPASPAVVSGGITLSYRELEQRANRLAHALRKRGVGRDVLVGLCVSRSPDMVAGLLGILKAGGAYVPLDPGYPPERLALMLEDCKPRVIVTERDLRASLPSLPENAEIVYLDGEDAALATESTLPPKVEVAASDLAYAIYTSGSTGRPKAALLTHGGLANVAASEYSLYGIDEHSRVLQFSSLSFDASLSEIAFALCSGAALYVEPRERLLPGPDLERYLEHEKITVLSMTPSALAMLDPAAGSAVEQVIVGGEPCPTELAQRWAGRCRFFNTYGPTETSIVATFVEYRDGLLPPLIGRPLPNVRVYLLDEALQPVPVGAAGEMYIGGVCVARGYLKRPELSAERFVPDPFSDAPAATMYRSGDFARRRMDGQIEFIGRRDDQVKVRGFRIELGEIEAGIARHPAVRQVSVVARGDSPADRRLVAYIVADNAAGNLADELRSELRTTLPDYMVPAHFVALQALPLTPNGKVDRNALPPPDAIGHISGEGYAAPRDDLEIGLATVWARVLGVPRVGITDNFFDHGGNSLLVLKLIGEMERATGLRIALGEVFRSPTIAGLVESCRYGAGKNTSVVVPLQPKGDGVPVFCICGINIYKDFAESLGSGQPVYGVYVAEEQAIVDQVIRGEKPAVSIERLVDAYHKAIARFRPEGPYRLAGLSFGGILAMELAAKMRKQGAAVDLVLLLDAALPQGLRRNWGKWLSYQAGEIIKGKGAVKLRNLFAKVQDRIAQHRSGAKPERRYIDEAFAVRQQAVFMSAAEKWSKSAPAYDFRTILFRASDATLWGVYNDLDEDYGWRRYLGDNLLVVDAIGGHRSIIEPPNVADLGRKARQFLAPGPDAPADS